MHPRLARALLMINPQSVEIDGPNPPQASISFEPAVISGLLEIVERKVDQKEIDDLDKTIPAAQRGRP